MNQKNSIQIIVYLVAILISLVWIYRSLKYGFDNFNLLMMSAFVLVSSFLYQFIVFITHCWKKNKHEIMVHFLHLIVITVMLYVQLGCFFISITSSVGEPPKYPLQ
jgi:hypothetical protein